MAAPERKMRNAMLLLLVIAIFWFSETHSGLPYWHNLILAADKRSKANLEKEVENLADEKNVKLADLMQDESANQPKLRGASKEKKKDDAGTVRNVDDSLCADEHAHCKIWAEQGDCDDNPGYMLVSCKKSCGACDIKDGWNEFESPGSAVIGKAKPPEIDSEVRPEELKAPEPVPEDIKETAEEPDKKHQPEEDGLLSSTTTETAPQYSGIIRDCEGENCEHARAAAGGENEGKVLVESDEEELIQKTKAIYSSEEEKKAYEEIKDFREQKEEHKRCTHHLDLPFQCDDTVDASKSTHIPLFFMHGMEESACQAMYLFETMQQLGLTGYACSIHLYEKEDSITISVMEQANQVADFIRHYAKDMNEYQLLCHSTGALICRAVLQIMDDHRVSTAVLVGGPLQGVFGYMENNPIALLTLRIGHNLLNSEFVQEHFSVANILHDPEEHKEYEESNLCIPVLDGFQKKDETGGEHDLRVKKYKKNFQRIKKLILLASPAEEILVPWQSAHFGFYEPGHAKDPLIVSFNQLKVDETLGLSEMQDDGRLDLYEIDDVKSRDWFYSDLVIKSSIIPALEYTEVHHR